MTTTQLDDLSDKLAKTDSTAFPAVEKLLYYNIAYGLLYAPILDEHRGYYEQEDTKDTVAGQHDYLVESRIHHVNWLKIDYGSGFVTALHMDEADLIKSYGDALESTLDGWSASDPIYHFKNDHLFVYPAPAASQAGTDRLWVSQELYPADLEDSDEPELPPDSHYLLAVYAAYRYHENNGETAAADRRKTEFFEGRSLMLETMFPRALQEEILSTVPEDDGSDN